MYVAKSWGLKKEGLGIFLRKNGIYLSELNDWKEQMQNGLEKEQEMGSHTKAYFRKKIERLEKELAGAQTIIEVQKKVQKVLAGEEKSTQKKLGKKSSN